MEILTYPVGLLIGLFPVVADLGNHPEPVEVLVDGRPGCVMSGRAPGCTVDLGPDPAMHLLELVRRDPSGVVVERARRWINRPGIEAEVRAAGQCTEKTQTCEFTINWAHPARLDPSSLTVDLDGVTVSRGVVSTVRAPFPRKTAPQVVTADATFPDGRRTTFTRLLHSSYPEATEASLQAVPVLAPPGIENDTLAESLRLKGWPAQAVEKGGVEVIFVVEPGAFESVSLLSLGNLAAVPLEDAEEIRVIVANESIKSFEALGREVPAQASAPAFAAGRQVRVIGEPATSNHPERWLRRVYSAPHEVPSLRRLRTSDAVAVAGYELGGSPRRRAVVLIAGSTRADESTFTPDQARAYLQEVQVPLYVWRLADGAAPAWPSSAMIPSAAQLTAHIALLKQDLERQRVLWVDGHVDPRRLDWPLPEGVSLAGRETSSGGSHARVTVERHGFLPPVYSVAVDPASPETIYAGTQRGLQISRDGGSSWSAIATGGTTLEVYSLSFGFPEGELLFGSNGAIGRSVGAGQNWALLPTLAVLSVVVDPKATNTALAATRGGLFRTTDAGLHWIAANRGLERVFAVYVAPDPSRADILYSATAGQGVFRSSDGGKSWKPMGRELDRTVVRSIAVDPGNGDVLYAGTDGGVFASSNGGRSWDRKSSGLPRAVTYALRLAPNDPAHLYAGTARGLFESRDRAASWKASAPDVDVPVTALDIDSAGGRLILGTLGRGVVTVPLDREPAR
jgi:photosystem II stability/assembly factor-like uncharacterized protein